MKKTAILALNMVMLLVVLAFHIEFMMHMAQSQTNNYPEYPSKYNVFFFSFMEIGMAGVDITALMLVVFIFINSLLILLDFRTKKQN